MENNSNNDKPKIVLNRKMRTWNKYKKYVFIFGIIVVLILILAIAMKGCGGKSDKKTKEETTVLPIATKEAETTASEVPTTQAQTTTVAISKTLKVDGTAKSEDFNTKTTFDNAVFIGDFVVSGISGYGYLSDAQVISSNAMTSDRLTNYTNDIVAKAPSAVYIMIGINDLNYGTRSADDIYEYEKKFIEELKTKLPATKIYVLSVLPVGKGYSNSSTVKQSNIDALNAKMSENASTIGATYIDVASAYKDSEGYLMSNCTDSGYNIRVGYYGFLLNGIAGVVK